MPYEHRAPALRAALQRLLDQTPFENGGATVPHLETLILELAAPLPFPGNQHSRLKAAVRTLKDVVTAYHEAGHVLAYHALTPRSRVRLDSVCFHASPARGTEAGMTYTRIAEPWWPDPTHRGEVARELACVLAGKRAEPDLGGGVRLDGSDHDDQAEAAGLLDLLPEIDRNWARNQARDLLDRLELHEGTPRLAAHLYERWHLEETVVAISDLGAFLISESAAP